MIIEFMGLPGSGKTTFHRIAKQFFEANGLKVWVPDDQWFVARKYLKLSYEGTVANRIKNKGLFSYSIGIYLPNLLRYCCSHKRFVSGVLKIILLTPNTFKSKWLLTKYFIIDLFQYSFIHYNPAKEYDISLIDEGFFQHCFTYFTPKDRPLNYKLIEWYLSNMPHPNLVIHISVPAEDCIERMKGRGLPYRLKKESADVMYGLLKKGIKLFSFIEKIVSRKKDDKAVIVQLDDLSLENASLTLSKHLSSYL